MASAAEQHNANGRKCYLNKRLLPPKERSHANLLFFQVWRRGGALYEGNKNESVAEILSESRNVSFSGITCRKLGGSSNLWFSAEQLQRDWGRLPSGAGNESEWSESEKNNGNRNKNSINRFQPLYYLGSVLMKNKKYNEAIGYLSKALYHNSVITVSFSKGKQLENLIFPLFRIFPT